jgi:hypothetical protein
MRNVELIQDAKAKMLDEIVYRLWPVVKTGACRQNACTGVGELEHIFKMDSVVRRFPWDEHKAPPFF